MRDRLTKPWRIALWALALAVGIVFSLVNSHALQVIGFIIVIAALFAAVRPGIQAYGWGFGRRDRRNDPGLADDTLTDHTLKNMGLRKSGPEYIEEAGTPSADVWSREQQRFAEHDAERQADPD